jgi:glycosyltransferase involved in cell wall biosynthesis
MKISIKKLFFCFVFLLIFSLSAKTQNLKTSVIIPCYYKHFKYLNVLLDCYSKQTLLPDEIVVSVSESHLIDPVLFQQIEKKKKRYPFVLKIFKTNEKKFPGANRNIGSLNSIGDVLIYQDADDLPVPRRVEVIKYFFENFDMNLLTHLIHRDTRRQFREEKFAKFTASLPLFDISKIKYINIPTIEMYFLYCKVNTLYNGNISIKREVFEKIKWPEEIARTEDYTYNVKICQMFGKVMFVRKELLIYREYFSSRFNK